MVYEKFMLSDGVVAEAGFVGHFVTDEDVEYSMLSISGKELMIALDGKESDEMLVVGSGISGMYHSMNPYSRFNADRRYLIILFDDDREFLIVRDEEEEEEEVA